MRKVPVTFSSLLLASVSTAALSQQAGTSPKSNDDVIQLERVTVTTGQRSPKAIDKIPGAVTVITPEEIQHTLIETEDATAVLARTVPGYSESTQALSNTGENLRGRIALRLFDGIPQGSPLREGTRNATFTDMGIIGRIEVINGPSAAEGIGAAGGIINYISKTPTRQGDEYTFTGRYGTQFKDDSAVWKVGGTFARKVDQYDVFIGVSHVDRGITYDGNGRRIGLNTSGSLADTKSDNVFAKAGYNFGRDQEQRLQLSVSDFEIDGKAGYRLVDGDRAIGTTNTAEPGQPLGAKAEFNHFKQTVLSYRNDEFAGGSLAADLYYAEQAMRFPAEDGADRQDPLIAPLGTLVDQSEIRARKSGLRTSWAHQDLFFKGFELRVGADYTKDTADQRLALTDRLWVPPLKYHSIAPFAQVSYDYGPITVTGGFRRENGKLQVDDYTTTFFRNRVFVKGGTLDYKSSLPNFGAIARLPYGFSVFASQSKGFTLANVGIPLRNINTPGRSVDDIADLQSIVVKNTEFGLNWRNQWAAFSVSHYRSKSDFGTSLVIDPATNDFVLTRVPTEIKGTEVAVEVKPVKEVRLNVIYSHINGKTTFVTGGPLDRTLGVADVNPDKLAGTVSWRFLPRADLTFGATKLFSRQINGGTTFEENTKGYTLYDLSASYDTRYGLFAVGIENITDKFYLLSQSQIVGFRNITSGRGRVVSTSYTATF